MTLIALMWQVLLQTGYRVRQGVEIESPVTKIFSINMQWRELVNDEVTMVSCAQVITAHPTPPCPPTPATCQALRPS